MNAEFLDENPIVQVRRHARRASDPAETSQTRQRSLETASGWALISIAESLDSLVQHGIETYTTNGDGRRTNL